MQLVAEGRKRLLGLEERPAASCVHAQTTAANVVITRPLTAPGGTCIVFAALQLSERSNQMRNPKVHCFLKQKACICAYAADGQVRHILSVRNIAVHTGYSTLSWYEEHG